MSDLSDDLFQDKLELFGHSRTLDLIKPLPCDLWVASSAMQKSIRRGDCLTAKRALNPLSRRSELDMGHAQPTSQDKDGC